MVSHLGHPEVVLRDGLLQSDRPPLERILNESRYFRPDEVSVALELIDDALAKGAKSEYRFIVAVRDDKVAGYCCYGHIACTVHSYDIYWIAVDPGLHRSGIGKKLMSAIEQRVVAAGGGRIYLETSSKSLYEPTRRFYLTCGYKEEATLQDFYAPHDGKVIFVKTVEPLPAEQPKKPAAPHPAPPANPGAA